MSGYKPIHLERGRKHFEDTVKVCIRIDINLFTSRGDGNSAMSPEMMKSSTDINLYTSRGDGN